MGRSAALGLAQFGEFDSSAQVDAFENPVESRVSAEALVAHRDREAIQKVGGRRAGEEGDLQFVEQVEQAMSAAQAPATALPGRVLGLNGNQRLETAEDRSWRGTFGLRLTADDTGTKSFCGS